MNRWVVRVIGFAVPFLVLGAFYWAPPYDELDLPGSLPLFGLVVLAVAAMVLRAGTDTPLWATWGFPAAALPAVIVVRIVMDTSKDPTSHNLWPFELVIGIVVGGFFAAVGVGVGELLRRWTRPTPVAQPPAS